MVKKMIYVFACFSVLAGCERNELQDEPEFQTSVFPVQFTIQMEREVLPFPETRSIPENTMPEPDQPAVPEGDAELNELCSTIEYVVYEGEEFVKHEQFVYDPYDLDADFGCVYDSLPQGNYTFYFVAHSSKEADLSGVVFSFDSVSDTFYEALSLEIGAAEEVNESVTLQRAVSRIEFMATDTVHDRLERFDMLVVGQSVQLSLEDGTGIRSASQQTISHVFTEEEVGEENKIHAFYTFIPSEQGTISVYLSAIAHGGELLRERFVDHIVPEKNKIIRYKGRLYDRSESEDTFVVSIYEDGAWEEIKEELLPE